MSSYREFHAEARVRMHLLETGCDCGPDVVMSAAGGDVLCSVSHAVDCGTSVTPALGDLSMSSFELKGHVV